MIRGQLNTKLVFDLTWQVGDSEMWDICVMINDYPVAEYFTADDNLVFGEGSISLTTIFRDEIPRILSACRTMVAERKQPID